MLELYIPETELYDERAGIFINVKETLLRLEHSLVSISKWEAKWHKPFMHSSEKTREELIDYVRCMTLSQNVNPNVYLCITDDHLIQINDYIQDPMTATWFSDIQNGKQLGYKYSGQIVTSELVYFWMISYNIPVEFQKWHFNRLMTLIKVCDEKNKDPKKMSKKDIIERNKRLNEARRKASGSKG